MKTTGFCPFPACLLIGDAYDDAATDVWLLADNGAVPCEEMMAAILRSSARALPLSEHPSLGALMRECMGDTREEYDDWFAECDARSDARQSQQEHRDRYREEMM